MSFMDRKFYFVKERVGFFKAANAYDILDDNGNSIGVVQEEIPNFIIKLLKFSDWKTMLPWTVWFYEGESKKLFYIKRGFTFFLSKILVLDFDGKLLGSFKQKFTILKNKFEVYGPKGDLVATLTGDWSAWDFKLVDTSGNEISTITKKWAGLGKELFTSADNYVVDFSENKKLTQDEKKLFFAASITIDMVLKEGGR